MTYIERLDRESMTYVNEESPLLVTVKANQSKIPYKLAERVIVYLIKERDVLYETCRIVKAGGNGADYFFDHADFENKERNTLIDTIEAL